MPSARPSWRRPCHDIFPTLRFTPSPEPRRSGCGFPRASIRGPSAAAQREGVLIEPGDIFFAAESRGKQAPRNYARLGFASIATERIEPGIAALAAAYARATPSHAAAR